VRSIFPNGATSCDANIKPIPYADEEALRTELEMMNPPGQQLPPGYISNSILDELKRLVS
jgi:hypothetical protein